MSAPPLAWQTTMPGWDEDGSPQAAGAPPSFGRIVRYDLGAGAWVEHCPGWFAGADDLFAELLRSAPWRQRERPMFDKVVLEPRLVVGWPKGEMPEAVEALRVALSERYRLEFDSVHINLYRDGADSVAWHGDTVRKVLAEPIVGIVSLGEARKFLLRPRGGRTARTFPLGGGDLLVMGGTSQSAWEHAVPKVKSAGPRMSVTFRHSRAAG